MSVPATTDTIVANLLTKLRSCIATGVMTKLSGADIVALISVLEDITTNDRSGLTDQAEVEPDDGRPAIS